MPLAKGKRVAQAAVKLLKFFGPKGEHWTHHKCRADKYGHAVYGRTQKATKWCLSVAMDKLRINAQMFNDCLYDFSGHNGVIGFNDSSTTYSHVRRFLKRVSKLEGKK